MVCLHQARTDFPTSSFIPVSASLTTAAGFAASSLIPYMLLNNSPRPWMAMGEWLFLTSMNMSLYALACLLSAIIKLIMRRAAANVFFLCFETAASWQHCIDYNTTSARLAGLGATPAAQVSGGHIPPSRRKKRHCWSTVPAAHHVPNSQLTALSAHAAP